MQTALVVLWLLVGICPDWWPFPRWRRFPPPPPPPEPPWLVLLSGIGGVLGGLAFASTWGPGANGVDALYAVVSSFGAVVGSIVVRGAVGAFTQRGRVGL